MATHKIGAASSQILMASLFFALTWHYPQFQAIMVPVSSPFIPPREAEHHMPSLFKFLFVAGMAIGSIAGGLLFLSEYAEPGQKEVRSVVSGLKVRR